MMVIVPNINSNSNNPNLFMKYSSPKLPMARRTTQLNFNFQIKNQISKIFRSRAPRSAL
jgi:hypothetical protein